MIFLRDGYTSMDTIKTCMQGDVEQKKYKGIVQTGRLLAEEYGVAQGLFKGFNANHKSQQHF